MLPADYPGLLTLLLKYPPDSPELPLNPFLLLSHAKMISEAAIPATGAAIVLQNTEKLGLPAYVPDGTEAIPSFASSSAQEVLRNKKRPPHVYTGVPPPLPPSSGSQRSYGFESLARGFMERAQASGIDKTIFSTVSEIKRISMDKLSPLFLLEESGRIPQCYHHQIKRCQQWKV